jgi:hypothetical protein
MLVPVKINQWSQQEPANRPNAVAPPKLIVTPPAEANAFAVGRINHDGMLKT